MAQGDGFRETHIFGDAADDDQERDDYGGARGHHGDPSAVCGGAPSAVGVHLADMEVHLKLVRAHLAVLEPAEQVEVNLIEMVSPPTLEVPTKGTVAASTVAREVPNRRATVASAVRKGESTKEAEVVFVSRGKASSSGAKMAPPPKQRREWTCPINECRESAVHPMDGCKGLGGLSVKPRGGRHSWSETSASAASPIEGTKRLELGATSKPATPYAETGSTAGGDSRREGRAEQGCGSRPVAQRHPP